jgi:CheY-like chemotaxis protein/HPt (histidine-containing phosphotransfer) domain-containing protein
MASRPDDRIVVRVDAELVDLSHAYLANRAKEVEEIKPALERQDFEKIDKIGHNMRGSGRMFGFEDLTTIGTDLQRAVAVGDAARIMQLQERMRKYVSLVEVRTAVSAPIADSEANSADRSEFPREVLVVDDDEMNRILVGRFLENEGYAVKQVSSGTEALAALAHPPLPVVVVLDVVMAGLSGFEVCRSIKSNPATTAIPVILVTGLEKNEDRRRGMEAGANDFLSKPVTRRELLARVGSLVRLGSISETAAEPHSYSG